MELGEALGGSRFFFLLVETSVDEGTVIVIPVLFPSEYRAVGL